MSVLCMEGKEIRQVKVGGKIEEIEVGNGSIEVFV